MKSPVSMRHAARLLNHGPTVLVSSEHEGRRNVMAAAWSMPVEFEPPRVAVVIDKSTYTRELIAASGKFALSIPCRPQADMTFSVGSVSGRDDFAQGSDKFQRFGIATFAGSVLALPLIEGCIAWMECRLLPEPSAQEKYDTCFGEVVSAVADDRVFSNGRWTFSDSHPELHTLHHLGRGLFALPAQCVQAKQYPQAAGRQ